MPEDDFIPPPPAPQDDAVGDLSVLLAQAHPHIERELQNLAAPGCPPPDRVVVLVMDGTSPIVSFAPPEMAREMVAGGASKWVARLVPRLDLRAYCFSDYPAMAQLLETLPECGEDHVQFVVSIRAGSFLRCTTCDLGMKTPTQALPS